ncbi:MAG: flagellar brake protein [Gammaproteobacteria bacterium]|nr:flagellar brake protein [Gammaproteobacteria bacterium]
MNLQPVSIEDIPIGMPLPWQLYDRYGYTLFARGEIVAHRRLLENLLAGGLLRDVDALPPAKETSDWVEYKDLPPSEMFPPQGIKPQVWERVQLRLLGRDIQAHHYARLIGYIRDQSILVTTPVDAGQRVIMVDGERVEVRMVTGSNIYVFQSVILRACISPSHYFHLAYPARVRVQKLRKSPWARVDLSASVTNPQGVQEVAHIVNLSLSGAQIHSPGMLGGKNDPLRITFHLSVDELETTLVLDALIQHVRPAKSGQNWEQPLLEYGVEFCNIFPQDALWLRSLVYQRIAEGYPV